MKIQLLTPDLNYTGAPIASLQLVKYFLSINCEVLVCARDGDSKNEFKKAGALIQSRTDTLFTDCDLYIGNTVFTMEMLVDNKIPLEKIFIWAHETLSVAYELQDKLQKLNQIRNIICVSQFQIEEYKSVFPNASYFHLRNCVNFNKPVVNSTSSSFAVVGPWMRYKNQQGLLDILKFLSLDISLNFIGTENPGFIDKHNFWGIVNLTTARNLISNSYGFISASKLESQNLSAIEAILSGIPVLLSNIPAHQELKTLIPEIILFNIDDPQSFYKGYLKMLEQKKDLVVLETNRNLAIQYFGWDAFSHTCDQIFSGVLEGAIISKQF